jgi:holin-like protein
MTAARAALQLGVLWAVYEAARALVARVPGPAAPTVVGILVLLALLATGVVRADGLEPAGGFLLRHLSFFFIPVGVELGVWWSVLRDASLVLAVALLGSAALAVLTTGLLARALLLRGARRDSRSEGDAPSCTIPSPSRPASSSPSRATR